MYLHVLLLLLTLFVPHESCEINTMVGWLVCFFAALCIVIAHNIGVQLATATLATIQCLGHGSIAFSHSSSCLSVILMIL